MSANLARTADGWWAVTPAGLVRLGLPATTTAGLLADRTPETLVLRGRQAAAACLVVRRGPRPRFVAPAFAAAAR